MTVQAVVRLWHDVKGWGVLDCAETPGGCWAHFSHLEMPGYRSLRPGQVVSLTWEQVRQDGYRFRAVRVVP